MLWSAAGRVAPGTLPPPRRRTGRQWVESPAAAAALIVTVQICLVLLVSPARDYPVQDEYGYARIVESLLHGQLHLSQYLAPSLLFHVWWGALWAWAFGFSFTVLSVAGLVAGALAALAFYGLLREWRFSPLPALVGALTLLLNPLFIVYDYSFQSEPTFLALMLAALWAFVAVWTRGPAGRFLLLGGLLSAALVLTRQVGFAVPVAAALAWLPGHKPRQAVLGAGAALGPALLAYGLWTLWMNTHGGPPWAQSLYSPGDALAYLLTPRALIRQGIRIVDVGGYLAWYLLPVFALVVPAWWAGRSRVARAATPPGVFGPWHGRLRSPRGRLYLAAGLLLAGLYIALYSLKGGAFNAGSPTFNPLGFWAPLMGADQKTAVFPLWFWQACTVLIVPLVVMLGLVCVWAISRTAWLAPSRRPILLIALCMAGLSVITFAGALYQDAYVVPLLPGFVIVLLAWGRASRYALLPAAGALALLGGVGLATLADYHAWQGAAWQAAGALRSAGVPLLRIEGGLEWNLWYLGDAAADAARARHEPLSADLPNRIIQPDFVLSFRPTLAAGAQADARAYTVCAQTPYTGPLQPGPLFIYTLSRATCPFPSRSGQAQATASSKITRYQAPTWIPHCPGGQSRAR